jgi:hypothetical protein
MPLPPGRITQRDSTAFDRLRPEKLVEVRRATRAPRWCAIRHELGNRWLSGSCFAVQPYLVSFHPVLVAHKATNATTNPPRSDH